ncbi:MAG TPA: ABC transporter permease [Steroidobacteraceae bacterium]|nr:ABC transporter permease [Steroidobacteraceae bacterium]
MSATMEATLVAPDRKMDFRKMARVYYLEAKYAFIRMLRNPAFSIPTLTFPLFFYLLIGFVFGAFRNRGTGVDVPLYLFCGFATMGAMTPGMFGFGIGLATEREQGLFTMKRALPMPPFASLFGSIVMSMLSTLAAGIVLAVASAALGILTAPPLKIAAVLAIVAVGALPFGAVGLWIGSWTSGRAAPAVVNIIYILLTYFSGLFIPLRGSLEYVPLGSPAFYLNQLALAAGGSPHTIVGSVWNHIAILAGVTIIFLGLAARRLRRIG